MKFTEINKQLLSYIIESTNRPELIKQLLTILQKYNYAFIGGFAVSFYSKNARKISPDDIDIMVSKAEVNNLKKELESIGFELKDNHYFQDMYWLVYKKDNQNVDIAVVDDVISLKGILSATKFNYHGNTIRVFNVYYLIINKLLAGRSKDHKDIVYLLKTIDDIKKITMLVKKYAPDEIEYFKQLLEDMNYPDNVIDQLYK